ncbi:MOB2 [Candida oxycetoniae]|uniref:MOB2 n=1 Tax=Candida oxycetoniae TaxID=497107 RepID=A0AAI9SSM8_9ASCO|nr:MOB2 [Candida oxycetoniae]KAI3402433.2 MOB2 [Candida oxycetoniae]
MSFLNTIRGLGRSSKKNKKDLDASQSPSFYSNSNLSGTVLKRTQSPNKLSPSKHSATSPIRGGGGGGSTNAQNIPTVRLSQGYSQQGSPTRRSKHVHPSSQSQHHHHQQHDRSPQRTVQYTTKSSQQQMAEPPLFLCDPYVRTALVKGSYKTIVQLPAFVDLNEWLALNVFEFFSNLDAFYGLIADFVTPEAFPTMNAGPTTNYLWVDASGQAVNLPACQYIEYVRTWISNKINDRENFPTKTGAVFPQFFIRDVRNISRQMFRIFAFIYYNQFDKIIHLSLEAHLNSFFAHFISFIKEFNLLDKKELHPLQPLVDNFEQQGKIY